MENVLIYLPKIFLALVALAFLFFGLLGWVNPVATVSPLDIVVQTAQAKTEIRATYGGFMVGVGLFIAYTAWQIETVRVGLIAVAIILLALGGTRLYGIIVDKPMATMQWQLLSLELIPACIAILLLVFYPFTKQ